jgi:glutaredoxin 3
MQDIAMFSVVVFSESWCPFCTRVKRVFEKLGVSITVRELDQTSDEDAIKTILYNLTQQVTVPNVFVGGKHMGGSDDIVKACRSGELYRLFEEKKISYTPWVERLFSFPSIDHFKPDVTKDVSLWNKDINRQWYIQEKIDGSQFSFRILNGKLVFYNKNKPIHRKQKNAIFVAAIMMIEQIASKLNPNFTYHTEAVEKPKHSTVCYDRTPLYLCMVYDIQNEFGDTLVPSEVIKECKRIGLEHVPILYDHGQKCKSVTDLATLQLTPDLIMKDLMQQIEQGQIRSGLGNVPPEGIVLKHPRFTKANGDIVSVKQKFVSTRFKERHQHGSKVHAGQRSPTAFLDYLGKQFANPARMVKAQQHLLEGGEYKTREHIPEWQLREELFRDLYKEFAKTIKKHLVHEFGWYMKPVNLRLAYV